MIPFSPIYSVRHQLVHVTGAVTWSQSTLLAIAAWLMIRGWFTYLHPNIFSWSPLKHLIRISHKGSLCESISIVAVMPLVGFVAVAHLGLLQVTAIFVGIYYLHAWEWNGLTFPGFLLDPCRLSKQTEYGEHIPVVSRSQDFTEFLKKNLWFLIKACSCDQPRGCIHNV